MVGHKAGGRWLSSHFKHGSPQAHGQPFVYFTGTSTCPGSRRRAARLPGQAQTLSVADCRRLYQSRYGTPKLTCEEEGVVRVARRVLLRLEQGVKVPEAAGRGQGSAGQGR